MHVEIEPLIRSIGYFGIFFIVFAESGLLIGFLLPGDSLLFTAGILASQGLLNIWILAPLTFIAAILGDNAGYAFGKRMGPRIFKKKDSILFHHKHVERAQKFYEKHGGKTLIFARFTPIVRTFAPILAGVGHMEYRKFFMYNVIGAVIWAIGLTVLGYTLGSIIPDIEIYLIPILLVIVLISVASPVIHMIQDKRKSKSTSDSTANIAKDES
ncbi:MAG: VTT domain-containing protein [bacterium]